MIFLEVLEYIWKKIVCKYKLIILNNDKVGGFWFWVFKNEKVKIVIVEGEKKVGVFLIKGYIVVLIFGIWNGRSYEDKVNRINDCFLLELEYFCKNNRWIDIVFDKD